jgi:hypothetical protein
MYRTLHLLTPVMKNYTAAERILNFNQKTLWDFLGIYKKVISKIFGLVFEIFD